MNHTQINPAFIESSDSSIVALETMVNTQKIMWRVLPKQEDHYFREILADFKNSENTKTNQVISISTDPVDSSDNQDIKVSEEHRASYYQEIEKRDLISLLHLICMFTGMDRQEIGNHFGCRVTTFSWVFENGNLSELTDHARNFAKTLVFIDKGIAKDNYKELQRVENGKKMLDCLLFKDYDTVQKIIGEGRGRIYWGRQSTGETSITQESEHFGQKLLEDFKVNEKIYEDRLNQM